jgi:anti-sigma factor RsiW
MKKCAHYRTQLIDLLENGLSDEARDELLAHIAHCQQCAQECSKLRKLDEVMNRDQVILPPVQTFERMKLAARHQVMRPRHEFLRRLLKVSVPAFALAAVIVLVVRGRVETVEISVPVENLLEDTEIAAIAVAGVVDRDILDEIGELEDVLQFDTDDVIDEMSGEEKKELVNSLYEKYAIGT